MSIRGGLAAVAASAALIGLGGCAGASAGSSAGSAAAGSSPVSMTLHGSVPLRPEPRPSFTLTDTSGAPYDFDTRTKGQVTLLFWGYTHCADTCPAVLHDMSLALQQVPPAVRRQVIVVFATSDPKRDTRAVVRRWLDAIDTSFVGLTGTPAQIRAAEDATGVPRAVPALGKADYAVQHFAGTTAYGRQDRVAVVYPSNVSVGDFAADLPTLVGKGPSR